MEVRLLFIGGTPRGYSVIKLLISLGVNVVFVYIMKEEEHEMVKISNDFKELCDVHKIPYTVCKRVSLDQIPQLLELKPDVAFVCGWRTMIPAELYKKLPLGCMAAHDSLLPKYRGFAPLNWAIINGEEKTGVTLFKIDDGVVDSGEVFGHKTVEIGAQETAAEIYPRIIDATVELYREYLSSLNANTLTYYKQDEKQATYTCNRIPEDGKIDWSKSSAEIFNLIRALSPPYPCAWTLYNGEKIFIKRASLPREEKRYVGNIPGRVDSVLDGGVQVLCGKGQIILNEIITSTGEHIAAKEFLSSIKITLGRTDHK